MEDWELITKYVSTWNYQILAMLFLLTTIILMALPRTLFTAVMSIACFVLFLVFEIVCFKRKGELTQ